MTLSKEQAFEEVQVDGLDGDWLHFGRNQLGSEVYLRIDNITRVPTSNVNICYFERMISNNNGLNNEGDKSTVIRRVINFDSKKFKDIEFTIFKQEMCRGASENFKIDEHLEGVWSEWKKDSWDEFFADLVEEANPSLDGIKLTKIPGRSNKTISSTNIQETEHNLHELNRTADWEAIAIVISIAIILYCFSLVV